VKRESEEAQRERAAVVSVFRPAMIIGSQHTPGFEKTLPLSRSSRRRVYQSIRWTDREGDDRDREAPPATGATYHYRR
jgi:hypothetical protein